MRNYRRLPYFVLGFSDLWSGQKPWWNCCVNPCREFRWSPEDPVNQILSPHLHVGATGIFFRFSKVCSDTKERDWGAESNGKLSNLFIPSKTATLVPDFAVEDVHSICRQEYWKESCGEISTQHTGLLFWIKAVGTMNRNVRGKLEMKFQPGLSDYEETPKKP